MNFRYLVESPESDGLTMVWKEKVGMLSIGKILLKVKVNILLQVASKTWSNSAAR